MHREGVEHSDYVAGVAGDSVVAADRCFGIAVTAQIDADRPVARLLDPTRRLGPGAMEKPQPASSTTGGPLPRSATNSRVPSSTRTCAIQGAKIPVS